MVRPAADPQPGSFTIVIPALNEELSLPSVLEAVSRLDPSPLEVIVVDAGSQDATVEIAHSFGVRVSEEGGLPGVSRNLGAECARGDWLLFLDADVHVAPDFLGELCAELQTRELDAASTWYVPSPATPMLHVNHRLSALYFHLTTRIGWPHSIGGCLAVRKQLHEQIEGFDPSVTVAEDQDYARRLARAGRYGFLRRPEVAISTRRFASGGAFLMSLKWIGIEVHRIVLGEIRDDRFRYFAPKERES